MGICGSQAGLLYPEEHCAGAGAGAVPCCCCCCWRRGGADDCRRRACLVVPRQRDGGRPTPVAVAYDQREAERHRDRVVVAFLHVAHRGGGDEVDKARGRPTTGATCAGSDRILSYRTGGSGAYMESDSEYLYVSKEKKQYCGFGHGARP